jgi:cell division transport system permease protein
MAASPLITPRRRPGATSGLIAAACLIMMLAAVAVLALGRAARGLEQAVASRVIVQVIEPDRTRRDALAAEAMAVLHARSDIVALRRLDPAEINRLIGPYLGKAGLDEFPVPAMIDLTIRPGANIPAISTALAQIGPITVEPAGAGLAPLRSLIETLRAIAFSLAGIAAVATALIAIVAARAAFSAEASTVAILHGLGATDRQVANVITGQIVRDAASGTAIGAVVALAAMILLTRRLAALGIDAFRLGWSGWIIVIALLLGLIALAAGAAQTSLLMRLGRAP